MPPLQSHFFSLAFNFTHVLWMPSVHPKFPAQWVNITWHSHPVRRATGFPVHTHFKNDSKPTSKTFYKQKSWHFLLEVFQTCANFTLVSLWHLLKYEITSNVALEFRFWHCHACTIKSCSAFFIHFCNSLGAVFHIRAHQCESASCNGVNRFHVPRKWCSRYKNISKTKRTKNCH